MGVMKKNLILAAALFTFACVQSNAAITVEQMTEPDYVINNGYSEATAEEVMLIKNRANGKPSEPAYLKSKNKFVRFCRNMYGYLDPAQDTDERIHHDVHMSPNFRDL
jgi:hypothetical protein